MSASYPSPVAREVTVAERLQAATERVAQAAGTLGGAAQRVDTIRRDLSEAEANLASARDVYDAALHDMATLMEEQGFNIGVVKARY